MYDHEREARRLRCYEELPQELLAARLVGLPP